MPSLYIYLRKGLTLTLLTLVAVIPRLYFAATLDAATDEPIYIITANGYMQAIKTLRLNHTLWSYNYEHPAFAKLLIGFSIVLGQKLFHSHDQLFFARLPTVILGTILVVVLYKTCRVWIGQTLALLAALALALCPYMLFYSSQALLDTTMVALISCAYLTLWFAIQSPRLYILVGCLVGLALASKYPAALTVGGMLVFISYYYGVLRRAMPAEKRVALPWGWWLAAIALACLSFFLADPAIWADPLQRFGKSLQFSLGHAQDGHNSFWAGQVYKHVPAWMILYVLWVKISSFITLPAIFFLGYALYHCTRFHLSRRHYRSLTTTERVVHIHYLTVLALLFSWLAGSLLLYSQLSILTGSHYYLPLVPPLILSGVYGLSVLVRYPGPTTVPLAASIAEAVVCKLQYCSKKPQREGIMRASGNRDKLFATRVCDCVTPSSNRIGNNPFATRVCDCVTPSSNRIGNNPFATRVCDYVTPALNRIGNNPFATRVCDCATPSLNGVERQRWRSIVLVGILALLIVGPQLWGVLTVYKLGGYTSELARGENTRTQVAYNGYSDAADWLLQHTHKAGRVGIVGGSATALWSLTYPHQQGQLEFIVTQYGSKQFDYDYLVWPMHLQQRNIKPPVAWRDKLVHTIEGGATTYCFIFARDPRSVVVGALARTMPSPFNRH